MTALAAGLQNRRLLGGSTAAVVLLAATAGAFVSYAPVQHQLPKAGLLTVGIVALVLLATRLPVSVLPLALVAGLLGLGNLELSRLVPLPLLSRQEEVVLLILAAVAGLGVALDASSVRRPVWPLALVLGGVFLVLSLGSLVYAQDRSLARWAVVHQVVQMAALAAGFFWIRRARDAHALVACLAAVSVASAVLGLWQFLAPNAFEGVFGPYADPNLRPLINFWAEEMGRVGALWIFAPPLAAFLSALLPALLYVLLSRRRGFLAFAAGTAFAVTATTLALTGTRMVLLGGVAGVVVFLAVWAGRRPSGRAAPLMIGVLVAATVAAASLSAYRGDSAVVGRLASLFGGDQEVSSSLSSRRAIYGTLMDAWRSEPLVGVGLGNTRSAIEDETTYNSTPHAYWLGLLAETGLIGMGLVAFMMAAMIPHYRRLLRRAARSPERAFGIYALATSTALLVGSLFDNAMLIWQMGVLFWLLQGAVLSLSLRSDGALRAEGEAGRPPGTEADDAR